MFLLESGVKGYDMNWLLRGMSDGLRIWLLYRMSLIIVEWHIRRKAIFSKVSLFVLL